jgi:hypothetical protein
MRKLNLFILAAWALHVASWFLPVLKAQDYHEVVPGWRAFRLAACAVWPCEGIEFETLHHAVLATISVITTLFFLSCSPLVVLRGSRVLQKSAAWAAAAAFAVNAHWIIIFGEKRSELTVGYFLWWSSFLLLATGLFMPRDEKRTDIPKAVAQNRAA